MAVGERFFCSIYLNAFTADFSKISTLHSKLFIHPCSFLIHANFYPPMPFQSLLIYLPPAVRCCASTLSVINIVHVNATRMCYGVSCLLITVPFKPVLVLKCSL